MTGVAPAADDAVGGAGMTSRVSAKKAVIRRENIGEYLVYLPDSLVNLLPVSGRKSANAPLTPPLMTFVIL